MKNIEEFKIELKLVDDRLTIDSNLSGDPDFIMTAILSTLDYLLKPFEKDKELYLAVKKQLIKYLQSDNLDDFIQKGLNELDLQ